MGIVTFDYYLVQIYDLEIQFILNVNLPQNRIDKVVSGNEVRFMVCKGRFINSQNVECEIDFGGGFYFHFI